MEYIALKKARFDRDYNTGEIVPDKVIAPEMAKKLVQCGVLQEQVEKKEVKVEVKPKRKGIDQQEKV